MPGKVFVNYRRDDARDMAARIRDRLAVAFGDANVFMDVDHLRPGQRFDQELEKALIETDVFLAVIGPRWLELLSERQSSKEHDYVWQEIAAALQRGTIVIPVLIERTPLPRADLLPGDIRDLVLHQKHVVTYEQFGRDAAGLVDAIRDARRKAGSGGHRPPAVRWASVAVSAVLVLLGIGWLIYPRSLPRSDHNAALHEDQAKPGGKEAEARRTPETITTVLAFEFDTTRGWTLKNIGREPALDIIVAERSRKGAWTSPVRIPPLGPSDKFVLTWQNLDVDILGATYRSSSGQVFSAICENDLTKVEAGNKIGEWPDDQIERHWNMKASR